MDSYCFSHCTGLKSVNLSEGITKISSYCFYDCTSLKDINLPEGITSLGSMSFYSCKALTSISLPSTLENVGSDLFAGAGKVVVLCFAVEPPASTEKAMNNDCRLFVWKESVDKYKGSSVWNKAFCIKPLYPVNVIIMKDEITLGKKGKAKLEYSLLPDNAANKDVTWSSSDEDIVTVTEDGEITAVSVGVAYITAEAADGSGTTAECMVTVKGAEEPWTPVTNIKLGESRVTIAAGESHKLNATISPANATDKELLWKSSDPSVVTVNSDGTIVGVSEGKAVITAKATDGSGKAVTCEVNVTQATGIGNISNDEVKLVVNRRHLTVKGLSANDIIQIMNANGITVYEGTKHETDLNAAGVYIIKVKGKTLKLSVE